MFVVLREEEMLELDPAAEIKCEILYLLMQRPERPLAVGMLAEELALTPLQVKSLLQQMAGPVCGGHEPDGYLHFASSCNRAVYIP